MAAGYSCSAKCTRRAVQWMHNRYRQPSVYWQAGEGIIFKLKTDHGGTGGPIIRDVCNDGCIWNNGMLSQHLEWICLACLLVCLFCHQYAVRDSTVISILFCACWFVCCRPHAHARPCPLLSSDTLGSGNLCTFFAAICTTSSIHLWFHSSCVLSACSV